MYSTRIIKQFDVQNVNTNIYNNYGENQSEVILQINDFRELGYEYMKYCGYGKFINCNDCGRLMKLYSKDNQTVRCAECQHKHWNEYNAMKQREYYKKKKSV